MLLQSLGVGLFVLLIGYILLVSVEKVSIAFIAVSMSIVMFLIGGIWLLVLWLVVVSIFYAILK